MARPVTESPGRATGHPLLLERVLPPHSPAQLGVSPSAPCRPGCTPRAGSGHPCGVTRYASFFNPSPGLISSHSNPPTAAIVAAKPRDTFQPKCSASQGASVGESVPPTLAPVFMTPESVPAWRGARSMVLAQNAPTVK